MEETDSSDTYKGIGARGELHLSILIEQMRRQGYGISGEPPHGHLQKGQGRQGAVCHRGAVQRNSPTKYDDFTEFEFNTDLKKGQEYVLAVRTEGSPKSDNLGVYMGKMADEQRTT